MIKLTKTHFIACATYSDGSWRSIIRRDRIAAVTYRIYQETSDKTPKMPQVNLRLRLDGGEYEYDFIVSPSDAERVVAWFASDGDER